MSISEGLDRWVDDFANINEDMIVDETESHLVIEDRPEDKIEGDGKKDRKYPEKGLQYQRSVLMEIRSQLHKRLMKEPSIIEELLHSKQGLTVVKEA